MTNIKSSKPCFSSTIAAALDRLPQSGGQRFATIFEHGSLVVEVYAPRDHDPQTPHTRDEIYFVASGSGEYLCGRDRTSFGQGDLLFASAGVEHRFENFSNDLALWVMFYGPEGGESHGGD